MSFSKVSNKDIIRRFNLNYPSAILFSRRLIETSMEMDKDGIPVYQVKVKNYLKATQNTRADSWPWLYAKCVEITFADFFFSQNFPDFALSAWSMFSCFSSRIFLYTSGLLPTERINSKRLQDYADFELLDQLDDEFADPEFYVDQFYRQVSSHTFPILRYFYQNFSFRWYLVFSWLFGLCKKNYALNY